MTAEIIDLWLERRKIKHLTGQTPRYSNGELLNSNCQCAGCVDFYHTLRGKLIAESNNTSQPLS